MLATRTKANIRPVIKADAKAADPRPMLGPVQQFPVAPRVSTPHTKAWKARATEDLIGLINATMLWGRGYRLAAQSEAVTVFLDRVDAMLAPAKRFDAEASYLAYRRGIVFARAAMCTDATAIVAEELTALWLEAIPFNSPLSDALLRSLASEALSA